MSEVQERYYQLACAEAGIKDLELGFNPVVASPTGSGKSIILCLLIEIILNRNIKKGVLILSHVKITVIHWHHWVPDFRRYLYGQCSFVVTVILYAQSPSFHMVLKH